jgi:hypothetical protein
MDPKSSNKKIGIGISAVIVALVVIVPALIQKKANSVQSEQDSIQNGKTVNLGDSPSINKLDVNQQTQATPSNVVAKNNENEEFEDEDDGDDSIPSSVPPVKSTTVPVVDTTKNSASTYAYKNGTYTAVGSYMSPGGLDKIGVTLTINNGLVTDSSVQLMPGDNTSAKYEQIFADNYKQYVIGQNIATLNVGKVSRSSLTPKGFNDALNNIRAQAKV